MFMNGVYFKMYFRCMLEVPGRKQTRGLRWWVNCNITAGIL